MCNIKWDSTLSGHTHNFTQTVLLSTGWSSNSWFGCGIASICWSYLWYNYAKNILKIIAIKVLHGSFVTVFQIPFVYIGILHNQLIWNINWSHSILILFLLLETLMHSWRLENQDWDHCYMILSLVQRVIMEKCRITLCLFELKCKIQNCILIFSKKSWLQFVF